MAPNSSKRKTPSKTQKSPPQTGATKRIVHLFQRLISDILTNCSGLQPPFRKRSSSWLKWEIRAPEEPAPGVAIRS
jgi:hypothetical protein